MDFLLPPPNHLPPSTSAEVRQVRPKPVLASNMASFSTGLQSELPLEVRSQLQLFLESLPDPDDIARQITTDIVAQAGAIKPNSLPKIKPKDKPRLISPKTPPQGDLLNVVSDHQEYDINTQVFVAEGNVTINYRNSVLKANRVQLNTESQEVIADGNVLFTRGNQKITGAKLTYNYRDVKGELLNATGAVDLGTLVSSEVSRSPSELASNSITVSVAGTGNSNDGQVRRLGFIAERLIIDGDTWTAENLRVTNDPFSPPELELITRKATLTPISPTQNRLDLESPRIVFDQGFSLPLPLNSITIDRFQRFAPALIGFDRRDRDGAFYQQSFDVITQPNLSFQLSPQLLIQRAFSSGGVSGFDFLGVVATLNGAFDNGQNLSARASFSGLNFSRLDSLLRFNASYQLPVFGDYTLLSQYAFRDRIFNGSLGFQDVNNITGSTLISPNFVLGDSQVNFNYQIAAQAISALRDDIQPINTIGTLIRVQSAAVLSRSFPLLRGIPAAAEKDQGLRFSPNVIVPKLDAFVALQGVNSLYSNGINQATLFGTLGLSAEVGNFVKDFLDYTSLSVSYTQAFSTGRSPFLFDRIADTRSLTAGLVQQIYGPIRFGIQQSWNLDTGNLFDAAYSLEYARRTYAVVIRYNPTQGLGEFLLRISDFNWTRPPANVTNIQNGVEQRD